MAQVFQNDKVVGYRNLNYIVRHHKGTAGRFLERNLAHSDSTGASISGGGAEFLVEGGGIIYDSSIGTNRDMQVNSPVLTANSSPRLLLMRWRISGRCQAMRTSRQRATTI